jgi:hypothetical protein
MPLASILEDPNYVNANPATKQAIFDKFSSQDTNFTQANPATQAAIRSKYGVAPAPAPAPVSEGMPAERQVPAWGRENPNLYAGAQMVREIAGPTVSALGAAGGAALGTLGGPIGTLAGSAGGYAAGEGLLRSADVALGNAPSQTAGQGFETGVKDILTGATATMAGNVAAPIVAKGAGWLYDALAGQMGVQKAAKLMKEAFGTDVGAIRQIAKNAPEGTTAAQSIAGTVNPTAQALLERVSGRTPAAATRNVNVTQAQEAARVNQLAGLAGAETQTGARGAQREAKNALTEKLIPTLKTELKTANLAGQAKPVLEAEAQRLRDAAAGKVQDVRRLSAVPPMVMVNGKPYNPSAPTRETVVGLIPPEPMATPAGTRLLEKGQQKSIELGRPVSTGRYTYEGELAKKAEQVAEQAANASLDFGQAAQFKQAAADSFAAYGLTPLESKPISNQIESILKRPEFAGSRETKLALNRVNKDIQEWTNADGVIDGFALDSIRKHSINSVVQALLPNAEEKAQKALAAKLTSKIRPLIVEAIEKAGGTEYGQYLKDYAKGAQAIAQKKLGAKALDMYNTNPEAFVKLVQGNSPKEVEKVFGPGSYDIVQEMSADAMKTLKGVAGEVTREGAIKTQSAAGQIAYKELLDANTGGFKFPSFFSAKTTAANAVLDKLENRLGKKVMNTLTNAAQSGKSLDALLSTMPATERVKILRELSSPDILTRAGVAGTVNALSPNTNRNNLGR